MNDECGDDFVEATNYNHTLIDFEFGFNNFKLEQVKISFFIGIGNKNLRQLNEE